MTICGQAESLRSSSWSSRRVLIHLDRLAQGHHREADGGALRKYRPERFPGPQSRRRVVGGRADHKQGGFDGLRLLVAVCQVSGGEAGRRYLGVGPRLRRSRLVVGMPSSPCRPAQLRISSRYCWCSRCACSASARSCNRLGTPSVRDHSEDGHARGEPKASGPSRRSRGTGQDEGRTTVGSPLDERIEGGERLRRRLLRSEGDVGQLVVVVGVRGHPSNPCHPARRRGGHLQVLRAARPADHDPARPGRRTGAGASCRRTGSCARRQCTSARAGCCAPRVPELPARPGRGLRHRGWVRRHRGPFPASAAVCRPLRRTTGRRPVMLVRGRSGCGRSGSPSAQGIGRSSSSGSSSTSTWAAASPRTRTLHPDWLSVVEVVDFERGRRGPQVPSTVSICVAHGAGRCQVDDIVHREHDRPQVVAIGHPADLVAGSNSKHSALSSSSNG